MNKKIIAALFVSVIVFFIYLFTLSDYGISWDSATHFKRGQAYLHYFLTGELRYSEKKSIYQNEIQGGEFWLNDTSGHPPLNDNLAALSNVIFFQELGILGDVEAHNFFIIVISSLLIFFLVYIVGVYFGFGTGVIAGLIAAFFPLFFAEAHFNIKDPVETSLFTGTILLFIFSLKKKSWKILILSLVFFGCALSVKFDAFFIPIIIFIYTFLRYRGKKVVINNNYKIAFVIGLIFAAGIFYFSWPALWGKGLEGIREVLFFYKSVGSGTNYQPSIYYFFGFNLYPLIAVLVTTPPFLILLVIYAVYKILKEKEDEKKYFGLLFVIWFSVSILRVSLPSTSIYGGLRQIMQYIPPLSVLSAIGIYYIKNFKLKIMVVIVVIIALAIPIKTYHPNENVYFNFLIGGLKGATDRNFPAWGNSFGNAYKQGIEWINANTENNAKLTILQGELINAPKIWLRNDIVYSKEVYSGNDKKGEYIMELNFNDTANAFNEKWKYVRENLRPVYTLEVDSVPILFIWKNDKIHSF